jgi:hypothetical protein
VKEPSFSYAFVVIFIYVMFSITFDLSFVMGQAHEKIEGGHRVTKLRGLGQGIPYTFWRRIL